MYMYYEWTEEIFFKKINNIVTIVLGFLYANVLS